MTSPAVTAFIEPLSACFVPRPGQDFDLFAKQLIEDLGPYPEPTLKDAARELRRSHPWPTWPPIAECLKAVREAAHKHYLETQEKPEERKFQEIGPEERERMKERLRSIPVAGGFLTRSEMLSCPVGTEYCASDFTIRYPNGAIETWAEFRARRRAERAAA